MTAYEPSEWTDFFIAAAGASAALAGLVLVAVSINIDRILKLEGARLRQPARRDPALSAGASAAVRVPAARCRDRAVAAANAAGR